MTKPETLEEFKRNANLKHNNRFDYSRVKFASTRPSKTNVIIICPDHGEFKQTPYAHKNSKYGCPDCRDLANQGPKKCVRVIDINPKLQEEYHRKNDKPFNELTTGSQYVAIWNCQICDYMWPAMVKSRVNGDGCAACIGQAVTDKNNLKTIYPKIAEQWDYEKNGDLTPDNVVPFTHQKAWFICEKNHSHECMISNKVNFWLNGGTGCKYCSGTEVHPTTCLSYKFPELAKEWHPTLNGDDTPEDYTWSSGFRAFWKCKKGHIWDTRINTRTSCGNTGVTGCPECVQMRAYSKIAIQWIKEEELENGIMIQHALNGGEFYIKDMKTRVDGICHEIKTIFSFHGCYWHGHTCKNPNYFNKQTGKFNRELYADTITRQHGLESLGYKVTTMWECEYRKKLTPASIRLFAELDTLKSKEKWDSTKVTQGGNTFKEERLRVKKMNVPEVIITKEDSVEDLVSLLKGKGIKYTITNHHKYVDMFTLLEFNCKDHGIFNIIPDSLLNQNGSCPECRLTDSLDSKLQGWLEDARKLYGNQYDYSEYKEVRKIKTDWIRCTIHDFKFKQSMCAHLKGTIGCNRCYHIKRYTISRDDSMGAKNPEYIKEWSDNNKDSDGNKLTIFQVAPKSNKVVLWKCLKHKDHPDYECNPNNRLKGNKCPRCGGHSSGKFINALDWVMNEWDFENNTDPKKTPEKLTLGSKYEASWKCLTCNKTYKKPVHIRCTRKVYKNDCPHKH